MAISWLSEKSPLLPISPSICSFSSSSSAHQNYFPGAYLTHCSPLWPHFSSQPFQKTGFSCEDKQKHNEKKIKRKILGFHVQFLYSVSRRKFSVSIIRVVSKKNLCIHLFSSSFLLWYLPQCIFQRGGGEGGPCVNKSYVLYREEEFERRGSLDQPRPFFSRCWTPKTSLLLHSLPP